MESKAKFMGHPIHPMLIVFPLGLFVASVIFDIVYLINGNAIFPTIAFYTMSLGIIGGLVAAIFGFRDWLAIPSGTRAKSVGGVHGLGNLLIVLLFIASWVMRYNTTAFIPTTLAFFLTLVGVLLATVTGWLGGELVDRLGVGVWPGANLDASSSLGSQPIVPQQQQQQQRVAQPGMGVQGVPVTGAGKYREKHVEKGFSPDVNEEIPPHQMPGHSGDGEDPVEPDNLD